MQNSRQRVCVSLLVTSRSLRLPYPPDETSPFDAPRYGGSGTRAVQLQRVVYLALAGGGHLGSGSCVSLPRPVLGSGPVGSTQVGRSG